MHISGILGPHPPRDRTKELKDKPVQVCWLEKIGKFTNVN